jgi:hypothetical protein
VGLIEFPENLDLVNYIINRDLVGSASSCGVNEYFTYGDVQRAIWELLDDGQSTGGLGAWSQCHVDEIVADADANGEGFVPGCDELIVVILVPHTSTGEAVQANIVALPLSCDEQCNSETAWARLLGYSVEFTKKWGWYFLCGARTTVP